MKRRNIAILLFLAIAVYVAICISFMCQLEMNTIMMLGYLHELTQAKGRTVSRAPHTCKCRWVPSLVYYSLVSSGQVRRPKIV